MKVAAIVNTSAGAGNARRRWPEIARLLADRLGPVAFHATEARGHAAELARDLAGAGFETVIAAGGDGTLNEVVNGVLASQRDVRIGILPLARGGDFARTLGLTSVQQAADTLAAGHTQRIDAVQARFRGPRGDTQRAFVNMASLGLGAEVTQSVHHWDHLLPGRARYLAAAAPKLANGNGFNVRLWLDGELAAELPTTTIAVANGRYQGGGLLMAPEAALDDGLMDITLVERTGLIEVAANLRLLYSGALYSHPKVHHWRARRFRAEADAETPIELDGEPLGTMPFEAEVLPRALRLICPA
jgi:diacylglycerol kinase (ATP)